MSTAPAQQGSLRWLVCALLFSATLVNYMDRQVLALLKGFLDRALGWSAFDYGLVNSAFQASYALSVVFFGWFIDRFGTRIGYAVSAGAWSAMAMAHAAVSSVSGFFWARVGLGLGEGGNFPAAIKSIALWFPQHERAFATSLVNSGANVGAFLAPAIVPFIAFTYGWRWAFVVTGASGFLWLAAWLLIYNNETETSVQSSELEHDDRSDVHVSNPQGIPAEARFRSVDKNGHSTAAASSWASLLRHRQTWAFISAKFITDPIWWFFLIWLPDLFKRSYGLDIRDSWDKLITVYGIITAFSIAGAWLTGYLIKGGWTVTQARKTVMLLCALSVLPVWIIPTVTVWVAVLLIALAGAAHQAWAANLYSTVSDIFPNRAVASVTGLGSLAGAVGGIGFPLYCGYVLDSFTTQEHRPGGYAHLLHVCAATYLIAFAINHWLAPNFSPLNIGSGIRAKRTLGH
jgi:MFS transporter, ACS family, hexuronate transporter